jgi:hypothetical protein
METSLPIDRPLAISPMPKEIDDVVTVSYRSGGLGIWGTLIRAVGMPLEKIALNANSAQVSGSGQFSQAFKITFEEGWTAPFRVLTPRSGVAWFLQYSIMGFTFQIADRTLSNLLGVEPFEVAKCIDNSSNDESNDSASKDGSINNNIHEIYETREKDFSYKARFASKMVLAPLMASSFESLVSNKAEAIRFYGPEKFAKIEAKRLGNVLHKVTGPAYGANVGRNFLMCSSAFVVTPYLFGKLPDNYKTSTNLFWFGLCGNWAANVAAVQCQSLWGRSLDYMAVGGGRPIKYFTTNGVIRESLKKEGMSAFCTPTKYFSRVLMNCPAQGTIPWFYNSVLPIGESGVKNFATTMYNKVI